MKEESAKKLKTVSKVCAISAWFFSIMGVLVIPFILQEKGAAVWIVIAAATVCFGLFNGIHNVIEKEKSA
jgi:hypothetical protein